MSINGDNLCLRHTIRLAKIIISNVQEHGPRQDFETGWPKLPIVTRHDFETGCPKLPIVKFWGILFFRGEHTILRLRPITCICSLKQGTISLYNVIGFILRFIRFNCMFEKDILRNYLQK